MKRSAATSVAQTKSFAEELERRVAERTAELTSANKQLRKELAELKQVEEARREGELNFNLIVDSIPAPVAVTSPSGEVEALNKPTLEYFGRTFEELKGWKSSDVVHPDDLERTITAQLAAHQAGSAYNVESRHRRADGVYRWFNVLGLPLRDAEGKILHWFHLQIDIDDRKKAEALLAGEKRLLEMMAAGSSLPDVLDALCRFVEEMAGPCYCSVYLIDPSGTKFQNAAAPSLPSSFNDPVEGAPVDGETGPCGMAACLKTQVIASDIALDPRWPASVFRTLALAHGLKSCWSTPILSLVGDVLGTFAIYQNEPARPTLLQQQLIARFAHIASIAIERGLNEEALKQSERNLSLTINTIPTFISVSRPDGTVLSVNQAALDYHGITLQDVQKADFRTRFFHPDDAERLSEERKEAFKSPLQFEYEQRALGKDGKYRWFLVRCNPLLDDQGRIDRWYATAFDIEDRKRGEFLLHESELQFKTIFDEAGAGIALVDLTSEAPIQNNRALQKMLGCSQEELGRYETFDRLTHDDSREKDAATFRELKDGKRDSLRIEKHFVLKDGRSIWANVIFNLLRDEERRPRYIIAIHEDITERKLTLERLQEYQDLLDLAQKSAAAMAFDWYPQQAVNTWSPEQEALFGLAPGTFDGTYKTWKKMMYAPDWPNVVSAIMHAHETGQVTAEYRVVWPDGSLHWLSTNGRMFFDDAGEPVRMVGFTSDVTRRKLVEEELRRSEAFLAEAQRLSSIGSFSWCVETDEITWSEQLYRIYELDPKIPITFEVVRSRVHPQDVSLFEKMVEEARRGGNDFEWHFRLLMPDQSIKYMHAVAHATRNHNGELEYIAAVQDVTARRLSEEAVDKARSELAHVARVMTLGALTASIAHEVNQPLSGIITNASTCVRMLDADPPNVDGARETAHRTIRDGRRAADVITRLRALFSKKDVATELVDLNEATREVIALSRSELERNRVITLTELAHELPLVTGDRVQLQQVILNLLRNGSDAMSDVDDRPRQLLFRTEVEEGSCVRVSVQDAGTGIEPQTLDRLFQTFYTTKKDGMGIGLSVSRSIIENHRGRLWATPNNGPGVTFSFSIPCAVEDLTDHSREI
jgi:PAS domain S-box-containing protein